MNENLIHVNLNLILQYSFCIMKTLVIVESATKAKTISKYLNSVPELVNRWGTFSVVASFGHVRDMKKKELSVNVEHGFAPIYEVIGDKAKLLSELKTKIKGSDMVFLASDNDREGEAIAWHIREHFKLAKGKYKRIVFNEITKPALVQAVKNAGDIDMAMVNSQQARRVLDRLVGYKLSPVLWKQFSTSVMGLSAGRVQSAVLKIIADREREVEEFESSPYWSCEGTFSNDISEAKLYNKQGTVFKEQDKAVMTKLVKSLSVNFSVEKCESKKKKVKPDDPFITSSLQQEAYNKLGMGVKRTMALAQGLYEHGHITYMRTDSYNMSDEAVEQIKEYVEATYGQQYCNQGTVGNKKKGAAHAQEAHECIRPTKVHAVGLETTKDITKDHIKLYELIWKRAVASRMSHAIFEEVTVTLVDKALKSKGMYFVGKFKKLEFEGYLIVYGQQRDGKDLKAKMQEIQRAKIVCKEIFARNTWTSPPARFNESSLIKVLDTEGIGRPSTYASIMSKLQDKNYVDKLDTPGKEYDAHHMMWDPAKKSLKVQVDKVRVGKDTSRLVPSVIGASISEFLDKHVAYITDRTFTASMENELDDIANGKKQYGDIMNAFWKPFSETLANMEEMKPKRGEKVVLKNESTAVELNGTTYTVRVTRFGPTIQYTAADNKTVYKDLKSYLKIKGMDYRDVRAEDVAFLLKLPYSFKNGYELKMGPYGLYIQKDGKTNHRIPQKHIDKTDLELLFKLNKSTLDAIAAYEKKTLVKGKGSPK